MIRWRDGVLAALFAAYCVVTGCFSAAAQGQQRAAPCGGEPLALGRATRVIDGRTFVLEGERQVRLAGIEVPPVPLPEDFNALPNGKAALDALAGLIEGSEVVLQRAEAPSDRYGRLVAYAFTQRDGVERFVQAELISAGFARVAARVGERDCAAELFSREKAARQAKLGLWANSYYDLLNAANPADVLAEQGRFALVEARWCRCAKAGLRYT